MTPQEFVAKWSKTQQQETAVFRAYGWPSTLDDEQILERLLQLNLERANSKQ